MDLGVSDKVKPLIAKGGRFAYTPRQTEILEDLKAKARERGL